MTAAARRGVAVGFWIIAMFVGARVAAAGPVQFREGEVRLEAGDEQSPEVHPVTFPSSAEYLLNAMDVARSSSHVRYSFREADGGVVLAVTQDHHGDARGSLTVTFTTDGELQYSLSARPGINFSARLDDVVADAFFNPLSAQEAYRGTLVHLNDNGRPDGFEEKTFFGELAPGTHTFVMEAFGGIDRGTPVSGDGFARLAVSPAASAIPLPPGAWPALATLATLAAVGAVRRRYR